MFCVCICVRVNVCANDTDIFTVSNAWRHVYTPAVLKMIHILTDILKISTEIFSKYQSQHLHIHSKKYQHLFDIHTSHLRIFIDELRSRYYTNPLNPTYRSPPLSPHTSPSLARLHDTASAWASPPYSRYTLAVIDNQYDNNTSLAAGRLLRSRLDPLTYWPSMMTSLHGNAFRVTASLWGESTGNRWIPLTNGQWCEAFT